MSSYTIHLSSLRLQAFIKHIDVAFVSRHIFSPSFFYFLFFSFLFFSFLFLPPPTIHISASTTLSAFYNFSNRPAPIENHHQASKTTAGHQNKPARNDVPNCNFFLTIFNLKQVLSPGKGRIQAISNDTSGIVPKSHRNPENPQTL